MNRVGTLLTLILVTLFAAGPFGFAAEKGPSEQELAKISSAAPEKARVAPEKPRKLLIFSKSYGYYHTSIPYGQAAFRIMGQKTGAYEPVVSDDIEMFEPDKLAQFDAVLLNNINEDVFAPEDIDKLPLKEYLQAVDKQHRLEKSLADFIRSGKGLVAIHAATNAFLDWYEYGDIIGARFDNHPWLAGSEVTFKVEEPNHPVAAAFSEPTFTITEETYQFKGPYSRDKLRVLLSIDNGRTKVKLDHVSWIHRRDYDFAISWVKSYGKGRVFYCAIGHEHKHFWNPVILQHYLDGIQFALGDLKADTTPSAKLKAKAKKANN